MSRDYEKELERLIGGKRVLFLLQDMQKIYLYMPSKHLKMRFILAVIEIFTMENPSDETIKNQLDKLHIEVPSVLNISLPESKEYFSKLVVDELNECGFELIIDQINLYRSGIKDIGERFIRINQLLTSLKQGDFKSIIRNTSKQYEKLVVHLGEELDGINREGEYFKKDINSSDTSNITDSIDILKYFERTYKYAEDKELKDVLTGKLSIPEKSEEENRQIKRNSAFNQRIKKIHWTGNRESQWIGEGESQLIHLLNRLALGGLIENSNFDDLIKEHFGIGYSFFQITDKEFIVWTGTHRELVYLINRLIHEGLILTESKWELVHQHFRYYGRDKKLRKFEPNSLSSTASREGERLNSTYCRRVSKIIDDVVEK
jgi:hypothetical protein